MVKVHPKADQKLYRHLMPASKEAFLDNANRRLHLHCLLPGPSRSKSGEAFQPFNIREGAAFISNRADSIATNRAICNDEPYRPAMPRATL
jgi:hypothetical protein